MGLTSHQALAALVGVSWQTVQLWEKEGGTAPNRNRIGKVAEVLGVTPEWLQHGVDTARPKRAAKSDQESKGQPTSKATAPAPRWMDAEAYRLLELYYLSDAEGRERIARFAKIQADAAAQAVVSNKG